MRTCGRVRVYVRTCRWWRMRARTTDEDPPPIPAPCRGCGRCICDGCTEGTRVVVPVAVRCPRGPLFASTAGAGHAGLLDRWTAGPLDRAAGLLALSGSCGATSCHPPTEGVRAHAPGLYESCSPVLLCSIQGSSRTPSADKTNTNSEFIHGPFFGRAFTGLVRVRYFYSILDDVRRWP